MSQLDIALVQMRSGIDPEANIKDAIRLIRDAAATGAQLVATPETTHLVQKNAAEAFKVLHAPETEPALPAFSALAH